MIMKKLEILARERGYTVKRKGRTVTWYRNDDVNKKGVSEGVFDAYQDIIFDYEDRLKAKQ